MGYPGGYSTLSEAPDYGIRIGKKARKKELPQQSGSFFKPSNAAMLFLSPEKKFNKIQKELIHKLCKSIWPRMRPVAGKRLPKSYGK